MTDQPQPPRQFTIQDILADLPKIREVATRPAAQNPMLAALLQQAAALDQIAGWASTCEQIAEQQPPPTEAPAAPSNGHADVQDTVLEMVPGRRKGGET